MIKVLFRLALLLVILGLVNAGGWVTISHAQGPSDWQVEVLAADAEHIVLTVIPPAYTLTEAEVDGQVLTHLTAPESAVWGQPGQPALPMLSLPLALPNVNLPNVTILAAETETLSAGTLLPVPRQNPVEAEGSVQWQESYQLDTAIYSQDQFWPEAAAVMEKPGLVRQQAVARLNLYPFQYNPGRQTLRVIQRLELRVDFAPAGERGGTGSESEPFAAMLAQTLINPGTVPLVPASRIDAPVANRPASDTRAKLYVTQTGLHYVTYDDLQAVAPELVQADPRRLTLSLQDQVVPMYVEGQSDGVFNGGDRLFFYGQAIDSDYTDQNVYWLSVGTSNGARMATRSVSPDAGNVVTFFQAERRFEQEQVYWPQALNGEYWYWERLSVDEDEATDIAFLDFRLDNLAGSGSTGQLTVMLNGGSAGSHETQLYLNGTPLLSGAEQSWGGTGQKRYTLDINHADWQNGTNTLRIESNLPGGSDASVVYLDAFTTTYTADYQAVDNLLQFSPATSGTTRFDLDGFSTASILALDISDPTAPVRLSNPSITVNNNAYRLSFSDDVSSDQHFVAAGNAAWHRPGVEVGTDSNWQSSSNGATYLIVTHPDFYDSIQPLAQYRRDQGETVAVVKTTEIYDEFNAGVVGPEGIKTFLQTAYQNWNPRPVYVLLVGDASTDPMNRLGASLPDLLPSYFMPTPLFGRAPNDAWYATVSGDDDYPDLLLGRLPARQVSDVTRVTDKVVEYEQTPSTGSWPRRVVLVADDGESSFQADMEAIDAKLSDLFRPKKLYEYSSSNSVYDEVQIGALLLAYSGHGTESKWGSWGRDNDIFTENEIRALTNGTRLPFMTVANCLNGFFAAADNETSLAEEFVLLNHKGGIGAWAPSSLSFPSVNSIINDALYESIFQDQTYVLGSAVTTARLESILSSPQFSPQLFETFTYFGDPALRLNAPPRLDVAGDGPAAVTLGNTFTVDIDYDVAQARARNLTLEVDLPSAVTFVAANPEPASVYANQVTFKLGDVDPESGTVELSLRLKTAGLSHGETLRLDFDLSDDSTVSVANDLSFTTRDQVITGLAATNSSPNEIGTATNFSAAVGDGTNIIYTWDFADGSPTVNGTEVSHTYGSIGTYVVQVEAANGVSTRVATTTVAIGDVPPQANFTTSGPNLLGQTSTFESTSLGSNLVYRWDFGDGSPILDTTEAEVNHTYAALGSYTVVMTATNTEGSDSRSRVIEILGLPEADFSTSSPDTIGQTTSFTNLSRFGGDETANVSYLWDFGDGNTSTAANPVHTYAERGNYLVSLQVTNRVAADITNQLVEITDVPLSGLSAGNNSPTRFGQTTRLTATIAAGTNVSYLWDFGDGFSQQAGASIDRVYSAVGVFTARVTATNSLGSQSAATQVTITDIPPQADFVSNTPAWLADGVRLESVSSGTNLNYQWNFGDGSPLLLTTTAIVTHVYATPGAYTVTLQAANGAGTSTQQRQIYALTEPAVAFEATDPTYIGQSTSFTNLSDGGGDGAASVSYFWDFGDGAASVAANPEHRYDARGVYTVSLRVSNRLAAASLTRTVTVADVPVADILLAQNGPTLLGSPTFFTATVGSGTNLSYHWDFGDGNTALGRLTDHTYDSIGSYPVTVTVSNTSNTLSQTTTVAVTDVPPQADFLTSAPDLLGQQTRFENISQGSNLTTTWNFGDGTASLMTDAVVVTHTYAAGGRYTITLTAANSAGTSIISRAIDILLTVTEPTAGFFSTSPDQLGETTIFYNNSLDGGADSVTYAWDFGDGSTSTSPNPQHVYQEPGSYTAWLTITTVAGQDVFSAPVEIGDVPIRGLELLSLTESPVIGEAAVLQANVQSGTGITYTWNLGDGTVRNGNPISHTYTSPGTYIIVLSATNSLGTRVVTSTLTVDDAAITDLAIVSNSPVVLGQSLVLTPTFGSGSNVAYLWQFGDGFTSTLAAPTYVYAVAGTYTVLLEARNSRGSRVAAATVDVLSEAISGLQLSAPTLVTLGQPALFTATVATGEDVRFNWTLGDGTGATGQEVLHFYSQPGAYTVTVRAANNGGAQSLSRQVQVQDVPIAGLRFTHDGPVEAGQTLRLFSTVDAGSNVQYTWDFGDGGIATVPNPEHVYDQLGTYTITLTAGNSAGSQIYTDSVNVYSFDEPITGLGIDVDSPLDLGQVSQFEALRTGGSNVRYHWDFGDGMTSTLAAPTHTYAAVGNYNVSLVASNGQGSSLALAMVEVRDAPILGAAIDQSGPTPLGEATEFAALFTQGSNVQYQWQFGDGATAAMRNPVHTYVQTGTFTVVLTMTNLRGQVVLSDTVQIFQSDQPVLELSITATMPVQVGVPVTFTPSFTGGTNLSYHWDFGDGGQSVVAAPAYTYTAAGDYTVVLTVSNSWGNLVETLPVVVNDLPIVGLRLSHNAPRAVGELVTFTASVDGGTNVLFEWDFGDGGSALGATVSHRFERDGAFDVTLTASNSSDFKSTGRRITILSSWPYAVYLPISLK